MKKILIVNPITTDSFNDMTKNYLEKIKSLDVEIEVVNIKAGNARRIIIKNEDGEPVAEFPLTVGAVGALVAPILAAVGAMAALLTKCTIVVEKK